MMYNHVHSRIITGVYGGSFNPIHVGHTAMAERLVSTGMVDELWLVVSPQNPLKCSDCLWDDGLRLELARLAVSGIGGVEVSDIEFGLPRPNYMADTLLALSRRYPEREFVLVVGWDNWAIFERWYHWQEILGSYRVIVLPRSQQGGDSLGQTGSVERGGDVRFAQFPLVDMSSTWIRHQIVTNPQYDGLGLKDEVWRQIKHAKEQGISGI